jgi:hypothetical protein
MKVTKNPLQGIIRLTTIDHSSIASTNSSVLKFVPLSSIKMYGENPLYTPEVSGVFQFKPKF